MTVMLQEWVFTAVFLILVVLALRAALGRRMSAGLRYGLWAVVLVRLLVPVQLFTSPVAGMTVQVSEQVREKMAEKSIYAIPIDRIPVEEAEGYLSLLTDFGLTQEELAKRMGKSRPAIANALRLTALPPAVREMLAEGAISAGHGRAVLMVEGEQAQTAFAQKIVSEGLNVRQAEAAAKHFTLDAPKEKPPKPADENRIYIETAQKDLSLRLGRKVTISNGRKKGKLELEYYDVNDLNDLLEQLGRLPPVEKPDNQEVEG